MIQPDVIMAIFKTVKRIEELILKGQDGIFDINEAADYLNVSKSFLYRLTCEKRIPHYKPTGKRLYFKKQDLDAWLTQNRIATRKEIEDKAADYVTFQGNGNGPQK